MHISTASAIINKASHINSDKGSEYAESGNSEHFSELKLIENTWMNTADAHSYEGSHDWIQNYNTDNWINLRLNDK